MLGSVFTHMLPPDLDQYLSEVQRVLRQGGRCLISAFLLNEESLGLIADGKNQQQFQHEYGNCRVTNPEIPEQTIAYRRNG